MKTSNFLYFYISALVVGSILGMQRTVLVQGLIRMFVPLVAGTIAAVSAGILVGLLVGYTPHHSFFFIIVPIIAGGVGEGILPLSIAYSQIPDVSAESLISQLIPAAVIGNVIAIICAGAMKKLGEKRPELNGNGRLVKSKEANEIFEQPDLDAKVDFGLMGAGVLCCLYNLHLWWFVRKLCSYSRSNLDDCSCRFNQILKRDASASSKWLTAVLQVCIKKLYMAANGWSWYSVHST